MKFTKIALAVAALAASHQAAAVDIYASGSSALRDVIPVVLNDMCAASGREMYIAGTPIAGGSKAAATGAALNAVVDKDRVAFVCTVNTNTAYGALSGQSLTLHWSNEIGDSANGLDGALDKLLGGSITGVATVAPSTTGTQAEVNFVTPQKGTSNCIVDTTNNTISKVTNYFSGSTLYACQNEAPQLTEIGISDVEAAKFTDTYGNLPDTTGISATGLVDPSWYSFDLTQLTATAPLFAQGFALVVQDKVLDPTLTGDANGVAGGLSNLSLDQVAGILSGSINNWKQLGYPTSAPIKVCTRAAGSGTKATFSQIANKYGCYNDANGNGAFGLSVAFADTVSSNGTLFLSSPSVTGGLLRENATTGQVQACMTDGLMADGVTPISNGALAVGIIGLDTTSTVAPTAGYRPIAINGVNPYVAAGGTTGFGGVAPGKSVSYVNESLITPGGYPLWVESAVQKSAVSGAIPAADASKVDAFYTFLKTTVGTTTYTNTFPGVMTIAGAAGAASGHTPTRGDLYFSRGAETCNPGTYQ